MSRRINKDLLQRYRWFRDRVGGIVGHDAESALHRARAEAHADRAGWVCEWTWDDYADMADNGCERCERYAAARKARDLSKLRALEHSHECLCVVLKDASGEWLASLGGVWDPDPDYRRVCEADLYLEALHEIRAKRAARRAIQQTRAANDRAAMSYMAL